MCTQSSSFHTTQPVCGKRREGNATWMMRDEFQGQGVGGGERADEGAQKKGKCWRCMSLKDDRGQWGSELRAAGGGGEGGYKRCCGGWREPATCGGRAWLYFELFFSYISPCGGGAWERVTESVRGHRKMSSEKEERVRLRIRS